MSWSRRSILKWAQILLMLSVLLSLSFLLWRDFSAQSFQQAWQTLAWSQLGWALGAFLTGLVLKGVRLHFMAQGFRLTPSHLDCFSYQVISIALANLTPGRAGEFYKAFLLADFQPPKLALGTLITLSERLMDLIILLVLGCVLGYFLLRGQNLSSSRLLLFSLLLTLLALAVFGLLFKTALHLGKNFVPLLPAKAQTFLQAWHIHKQALIQILPLLSLWSLLIWGLEGLFQWSIFRALGLHLPLLNVIGISALVTLASILSLLPIGLGTVDLSSLVLYGQILNVTKEQVLLQVILARVLALGGLYLMLLLVLLHSPELVKRAFRKEPHNSEQSASDGP